MRNLFWSMVFFGVAIVSPVMAEDVTQCVTAGCSSELCVPADKANDIVSACEFRPEYQCYQNFGQCVSDRHGNCGWQRSVELQNCLSNPSNFSIRSLRPMSDQDRNILELERYGN